MRANGTPTPVCPKHGTDIEEGAACERCIAEDPPTTRTMPGQPLDMRRTEDEHGRLTVDVKPRARKRRKRRVPR